MDRPVPADIKFQGDEYLLDCMTLPELENLYDRVTTAHMNLVETWAQARISDKGYTILKDRYSFQQQLLDQWRNYTALQQQAVAA
jgi:hypothetical protein